MGKKLEDYYDQAKKMGGFVAQMRLAMLTLMPSQKAKIALDSPENIRKFELALQKIQGELASKK